LRLCRCGVVLEPPTHPANVKTWCTRACYARYLRYPDGIVEKSCRQCGSTFRAAGSYKAYCTPQCGWLYRRRAKPKSQDWLAGRQPERVVPCTGCGATLVTRASKTFCEPCRITAGTAYNAEKARQRAAIQRLTPRDERFRFEDIAERDGWTCQLCGLAVDPTFPRKSPLGATIDHVIPVVHGGSDRPDNVVLAHLRCNARKGARQLDKAA
jgi:5-methylcytosine-specific restriction endonuclease McrA